MSSLNSLYIKKEALETLLKGVNAKGLKGIELTLSINDEGNQYDQNISAYVAQTKEEREAKIAHSTSPISLLIRVNKSPFLCSVKKPIDSLFILSNIRLRKLNIISLRTGVSTLMAR